MKNIIITMNNGDVFNFNIEAYYGGELIEDVLTRDLENITQNGKVIPVTGAEDGLAGFVNGASISSFAPAG